MNTPKIQSLEHFLSLWRDIYTHSGKVSWEYMLPYYREDIYFKDAVQEIHGKKRFTEMTQRLAKRSKNLTFLIHNSSMQGDLVFVEWEMIISYKIFPSSSVYGCSRILLRDGQVAEQRDYYDLWGDIYDNIPFVAKLYRAFMKRSFG